MEADNTAIASPCTRFAGQDTAPELGVGPAPPYLNRMRMRFSLPP
jgi:hypothetical protein